MLLWSTANTLNLDGELFYEERFRLLGLTQEELANRTELTVPYISNIENNHTKLSLVTITAIANALETTIDSLMYDNLNVLTTQYDADIKDIVDDCTDKEKAIILDVVRQLKVSLRSN